MVAPAIDESQRLRALRRLGMLDTPPEERFDRVTRGVARALSVPAALISLVDADRQWFRSVCGVDLTETPRNVAFCAHVITGGDLVIIPDAKRDERFTHNPLVAGPPHIRFYAGVPLKTLDNFPIGTLCVFDYEPRKLDDTACEVLRAYGAWAESELNAVEARKAFTAAVDTNARLGAVLDNMSDALIVSDADGRIETCNAAAEALLGFPAPELIGASVRTIMPEPYHSDPHGYERYIADYRARRFAHGECVRRADDVEVAVERRVSRVDLHDGERFIHVIRDMRDRNELERLKSDFLAAAAHELRSPMASIYGFSELLLNRVLDPPRQRELLTIVHNQSAHMTRLINELLDLARIEARAGRAFDFRIQSIAPVIDATVASFLVPDKRSAVDVHVPADLPSIAIDADKLQQAMTNVLSNAYKYSPGGGPVTLSVMLDAGHLRIVISDRGVGMSAAVVNRVFERFYRADETTSVRGTGLGMTLVREIIENHGGNVRITSEPGTGTEVTFSLPLAAAA
jgi:PAS domain S-box-containing protein